MPSYLITGASRGLGLAFAVELLKDPENYVIATARNPKGSKGLQELAKKFPKNRLAELELDVADERSVERAVQEATDLLPNGLDNFISNAGVASDPLESFEKVDIEAFRSDLNMQLVSTVILLRAFLPLIRKGEQKKIMFVSSSLGSIELGFSLRGLANTYSVGKAGLNMLVRKWGSELKTEGITSFVIHPGWVSTTAVGDLISPWMNTYAPTARKVSEPESAEGCMKILKNATLEDTGSFFNFDETRLPW